MMMSEFIERTGYEPSWEEYRMIEESYYDFDGNKDEFCKQWKKDQKSGRWAKELKLRQTIEDQKNAYKAKIEEVISDKEFYREHFYRLKALNEKLEANLEAIKDLLK